MWVVEPTLLTYLDLDDPNDDEWYLEMQKHCIQLMKVIEGNRDLVVQSLLQLYFPYFGLVYRESQK